MGWFSVGIDPLLKYLERRLHGITICSLPSPGPHLEDGTPPQPVNERYTVYGYADDIKPAVTTMAEFALIDHAVTLFEKSSGNHLHRDPISGKCKVLPLGRWRNSLQQEDIGFPHLKITNSLSMVGVELTASWQSTRKTNMDELQERVQKCIGSWKSGKFMPLVCRPFSLNTYCSSKIWFRTSSVDMRAGDITAMTSRLKSWCYQDLYQKPSEVLLYREVEQGGLGLHHIHSKALANLIATFIQTAKNERFQQSLFHSWLYGYHVEADPALPDPGYTPYYDQDFFSIIREVKEKTPLNPVHMSVKEWYKLLLERNVTTREIDEEGRRELIPCKVEERDPTMLWSETYRVTRLKGLSPDSKSFLFKLIHTLLPSKERIHHLNQTTSPQCWCNSGDQETYSHLFYGCSKNQEAGEALLRCVRSYDPNLTEEKSLRMELSADETFLLPTVAILAIGLEFIWENRKVRKTTSLYQMRAELEAAVSIRRRSRSKHVREAGDIMSNMLNNFLW